MDRLWRIASVVVAGSGPRVEQPRCPYSPYSPVSALSATSAVSPSGGHFARPGAPRYNGVCVHATLAQSAERALRKR